MQMTKFSSQLLWVQDVDQVKDADALCEIQRRMDDLQSMHAF